MILCALSLAPSSNSTAVTWPSPPTSSNMIAVSSHCRRLHAADRFPTAEPPAYGCLAYKLGLPLLTHAAHAEAQTGHPGRRQRDPPREYRHSRTNSPSSTAAALRNRSRGTVAKARNRRVVALHALLSKAPARQTPFGSSQEPLRPWSSPSRWPASIHRNELAYSRPLR